VEEKITSLEDLVQVRAVCVCGRGDVCVCVCARARACDFGPRAGARLRVRGCVGVRACLRMHACAHVCMDLYA
jgi:hypothetical protein